MNLSHFLSILLYKLTFLGSFGGVATYMNLTFTLLRHCWRGDLGLDTGEIAYI